MTTDELIKNRDYIYKVLALAQAKPAKEMGDPYSRDGLRAYCPLCGGSARIGGQGFSFRGGLIRHLRGHHHVRQCPVFHEIIAGSLCLPRNAPSIISAYEKRQNAHTAVARAIKEGRLVRERCSVCGNPRAVAHHPDYDAPLSVEWLCQLHHARRHAEMRGQKVERAAKECLAELRSERTIGAA